jgi:hypothetical protein
MDWKYELLWNKSKVNSHTAHEQDKETLFFPLWCSIALETLSRATLSHVHPALLADPMKGSNLLYVFGYYNEKEPAKSVPVKTVFERLMKIVEKFTSKEYEICMNIMERRNGELHSGGNPFENYPTKVWLADYYRICDILLSFQKKKLSDWLPKDDAKIASEMIKKDYNKMKFTVSELIKEHKKLFFKKPETERKQFREKADKSYLYTLKTIYQSKVICPACKSKALISGEYARSNEPMLDGDEIVRKVSFLPTDFHCLGCELKLEGYDKLHAADLGGYISLEERYDPKEYYDFDPTAYIEEDYGND